MPSPFPGMDPYIEAADLWPDFHNDLASAMREQLNQRIRPRYVARLVPRTWYEALEIDRYERYFPDVAIAERPTPHAEPVTAGVNIAPAPVETPLQLLRVEVLIARTAQLVTVIEILSPSNKRTGSQAFDAYRRKRTDLLASPVHLLELDLLRGRQRPPLDGPVPQAAYYVTLSRADTRPRVSVWPLQIRDALPVIPVPLVKPDPDVALDLAAAVAEVYERGGYADIIDYQAAPPLPSLSEDDVAYVNKLLRPYRTG